METRSRETHITPRGKKVLAVFAGIVAAGSLCAGTHQGEPGNLAKYPEKQVVVTPVAPDNTIEGIAIDVNGPMPDEELYAVEDYLMNKENHGSSDIQPGQVFEVPVLHQQQTKK